MWPPLRDSRQKSLKVKLDARELARDLLKWIQPYDAFTNWPSKSAIKNIICYIFLSLYLKIVFK